jgi:hypothetical protein
MPSFAGNFSALLCLTMPFSCVHFQTAELNRRQQRERSIVGLCALCFSLDRLGTVSLSKRLRCLRRFEFGCGCAALGSLRPPVNLSGHVGLILAMADGPLTQRKETHAESQAQ